MTALRTLVFLAMASAAGVDASAQRVGLCPPDLDSRSAGGLGFSGVVNAESWSLSGVGSQQDARPSECLFDADGQVRAALYSSDTGRPRAYVRIYRAGHGPTDAGVPEVRILYTSYGDAAEFARQVAGQEAGLNRMTAGEIKAAIEKFRAEGRPSSAASAIRAARRQNPGAAAGRAGLHNPDCCIGGRPDIIQDFGGLPENSSLGSQNKNNVDVIYDTVKALPSDARVSFKFVVEQPRR